MSELLEDHPLVKSCLYCNSFHGCTVCLGKIYRVQREEIEQLQAKLQAAEQRIAEGDFGNRELAATCQELREGREQLQAKVPVWIPAGEFQAKLTEPYAEEWVGWKDKRGNDQLRRAYMDIGQAADYHWWDCKTHEALPPTFTGNLYVLKFLPPIPPLDQGEESNE